MGVVTNGHHGVSTSHGVIGTVWLQAQPLGDGEPKGIQISDTLRRLLEDILTRGTTHPLSLVAICTSVIFQSTPKKTESQLTAAWPGSGQVSLDITRDRNFPGFSAGASSGTLSTIPTASHTRASLIVHNSPSFLGDNIGSGVKELGHVRFTHSFNN
jgi:hypothetical protein